MLDLDPQVQKLGARWLFGAGVAAILLALFIFGADVKLTNSDREIVLEKTLKELRQAQASLSIGAIDPRIVGESTARTN